jgi:hypothetical protein
MKKKSACEDLACELKTVCVLWYSDIRNLCAIKKRIETSEVQLVNCED